MGNASGVPSVRVEHSRSRPVGRRRETHENTARARLAGFRRGTVARDGARRERAGTEGT